MANKFLTPSLTQDGIALVIKALYGEPITFTKIVMGNGTPPDLNDVTEMANPLLEIPLVDIDTEDNYVLLTGETSSAYVDTSFYGYELGVYAEDADEVEYLYAYRWSEQADFFPASSEGRTIELRLSVAIAVGNAENVTAILTAGEEYATKAQFNAHLENYLNPHRVSASDVGLGDVVNVSPENMAPTFTQALTRTNIVSGDTFSVILGKIAKVITDFISHLTANNPHGITVGTIGAASASHNHSTSNITSGILSVARGGTGQNNLDSVIVGKAKQLNTARTIQTNLGSTSSASFNGTANVTPGVTGVLPAANGGTGKTSLQATRNAMGLGNTTGALPIANGGTGATSVLNAANSILANGATSIGGDMIFKNPNRATNTIGGIVAGNDAWRVGGGITQSPGTDYGYAYFDTGDNGDEPIIVRQYSGRGTSGDDFKDSFVNQVRSAMLLDNYGNTIFPGSCTATSHHTSSDRKKKKDIASLSVEKARELIIGLNPVSFIMKSDEHNRSRMGFIAQEVYETLHQQGYRNSGLYQADVLPKDSSDYFSKKCLTDEEIGEYEDSELDWNIDYQQLIAPMVTVIQEQERRIRELEALIEGGN